MRDDRALPMKIAAAVALYESGVKSCASFFAVTFSSRLVADERQESASPLAQQHAMRLV